MESPSPAATIGKELTVTGDGKVLFQTEDNYHSFLRVPLDGAYRQITVRFGRTHGSERITLYACDLR